MMTPMARPTSALHSICILPATSAPATKTGSERLRVHLTLECNGEAFIGSSRLLAMANVDLSVVWYLGAVFWYTATLEDD